MAAERIVIIETTSTGIALLGSKLLPYVFALVLSAWTSGYGEPPKRKANERPPPRRRAKKCLPPPYTLVRCAAR